MEREAKSQRDLLESYLAKYREATARENIDAAPADGRIISRALVSNTPAFPKKLPIVLIATLATLMLSAGCIATAELLRMTAPRAVAGVRAGCRSHSRTGDRFSAHRSGAARYPSGPCRARHRNRPARRATARRRRGGAQDRRARKRPGRKHHADRADAGAAAGAQCQGRGGGFVGVVAGLCGGLGRSDGAGTGGTDAGRSLLRAGHHARPAVAGASGHRRTPGRGSFSCCNRRGWRWRSMRCCGSTITCCSTPARRPICRRNC